MNSQSTAAPRQSDGLAGSALEHAIAAAYCAHPASKLLMCMSIAAPLAPAERLLTLTGYDHQLLWCPSADDEHSGVGAAHVLIADGADRFACIRDASQGVFRDLVLHALDGEQPPEPRMIGSFTFQPAPASSALWRGFHDAQFVLPRIAYTRRCGQAWLTLTVCANESSSLAGRTRLAGEAVSALRALRSGFSEARTESARLQRIDPPEGEWSALVEGIRREIAAGRLEKVVAAQRTIVRGAHLPAVARVLGRLRAEAADCTRFALAVGNRTFLGASPERLVKRLGMRLWADAMAGSIRGDATDGRALLLSDKDGLEHAIVVREIHALLEPLCGTLRADGPDVHRLVHLTHLRTRFQGVLREPAHVLDLIARLHPTPAVGGTPRLRALAWLARHECIDRGPYAGPFGAFDRSGDGEFVVAIRSALMTATEAHLFAGAGIVAESEVESELSETHWKLRSLLAALGVE
jgi:isochorismate synthase